MKSPGALHHPTQAVIDLAAFRNNLDAVRSYVGPGVKIMAVVKANAYGHGALRLASEAVRWGVDYLAVARVPEGVELRLAGVTHRMLVFELVSDEHRAPALEHGLEMTVATLEGAKGINAVARRLGRRALVHVKVDTGMGRLGVAAKEASALVEAVARLPHLELAGVYSHFSTSEDPDQSYAREQLDRFLAALEQLEHRRIEVPLRHMANSGAIISVPDAHLDLVRPGIMLYGYPPRHGMSARFPLTPVMSLHSVVSFLKTVEPGTSISYGRRFIAGETTRIATVPIGYADGYGRLLTNNADVLIRGRRYPVVGTVTMDQIMVDVGRDAEVAVGDDVTLIGTNGTQCIDSWEIAERINTIPYEVTCLVTPRVPRVFVK